MLSISMFYGIIISMYGNDHNLPHFHARYQGSEAEFDFDGNLLAGDLPEKQVRYIQVWADIHREDLMTNWEMLQSEGKVERIEPLR